MRNGEDYLRIDELKDNHSYKIYARNAYVGIWIKNEKAFMISRYTASHHPHLFYEYHWDTGQPLGTVKPLQLLEFNPFQIKKIDDYSNNEKDDILNYLDKLEEDNPIIHGYNSLKQRKTAAISYKEKLAAKRRSNNIPIHSLVKMSDNREMKR